MQRLELTADTIGPVGRGHPWVYRSGLKETPHSPGTPVQLMDGRGKAVGFGLTDEGDISVRVLGRYPEPLPRLIAARIKEAAASRAILIPAQTNTFRVINGAGDGLPGLVVDRYGGVAVVRLYGRCWEPWLDDITAAVSQLDGIVSILRRYGVRRVDNRKGADVLHGPRPSESFVVEEAGMKFLVRPYIGQKTGLFLDQRAHRIQIGRISGSHKEVVNLFGYTGGFSVYAAAAGAARVTTVDISEAAIADARENFRLNGLPVDRHRFVVTDVFKWTAGDEKPDLLICDPPSLSRSAKSDNKAAVAYRDLATRCGREVPSGGLLATASCTARLSQPRWEQAIGDGLRKAGRWSWLWRAAEPMDHPVSAHHNEGRYLKFAILRRRH
ncbi:MAG: 23S rRNA (cytosine1962-C5)-methyltransferase [Myxococcota bacterium]